MPQGFVLCGIFNAIRIQVQYKQYEEIYYYFEHRRTGIIRLVNRDEPYTAPFNSIGGAFCTYIYDYMVLELF